MIPGEYRVAKGSIVLNAGRETIEVEVANKGDRPVQIGSHYHFFEVNEELHFDRQASRGFRLNIAAGTAVRFAHLGAGSWRQFCGTRVGGLPRARSSRADRPKVPQKR